MLDTSAQSVYAKFFRQAFESKGVDKTMRETLQDLKKFGYYKPESKEYFETFVNTSACIIKAKSMMENRSVSDITSDLIKSMFKFSDRWRKPEYKALVMGAHMAGAGFGSIVSVQDALNILASPFQITRDLKERAKAFCESHNVGHLVTVATATLTPLLAKLYLEELCPRPVYSV